MPAFSEYQEKNKKHKHPTEELYYIRHKIHHYYTVHEKGAHAYRYARNAEALAALAFFRLRQADDT